LHYILTQIQPSDDDVGAKALNYQRKAQNNVRWLHIMKIFAFNTSTAAQGRGMPSAEVARHIVTQAVCISQPSLSFTL
jgi:hypothetical protein